ncbi:MAG: efflux RND transporter permease subunit [Deltaproteobacteria bacterium]|nr:MAG: efflux RND transporter permease subunit [Deltaproteobacteria bacterium]
MILPVLIGWWTLRTLPWLVLDVLALLWRVVRWSVARAAGVLLAGWARVAARAGAGAGLRRGGRRLASGYVGLVRHALRRPAGVIFLVVLLAVGLFRLYGDVGLQLLPEMAQGEVRAELRLPVGTPLAETVAVVERVEARLAQTPEVLRVASFAGVSDDAIDRRERGEHMAELTVRVVPSRDLAQAEERVMAALRRALRVEPGLDAELRRPTLFTLDAPIAVQLFGRDPAELEGAARRVMEVGSGLPLLADVRTTAAAGFPEVRVRFDRSRMASLGLDVRQSAETLRRKVQGVRASELRDRERTLDIELAVDVASLGSLEALLDLPIGVVGGAGGVMSLDDALAQGGAEDMRGVSVPLRAVAHVEVGRGPAEIRRIEGRRAVVVEARAAILDVRAAREALTAELDDIAFGPGVRWEIGGQSAELEAAQRGLLLALLVAVFLVYVVMASTFESFRGPLIILFTIPLALVGVMLALFALGLPLSVVAGIGVIVLVGIVVNNAIVLVDAARRLEREGLSVERATLRACEIRLRPVCITALTTVLGLVPMAVGLGAGTELRQPLAWVVIGGLAVGTLLTLLVIPVLWSLTAPSRGAAAEPPLAACDGPADEPVTAGPR